MVQSMVVSMGAFFDVTIHDDREFPAQSCTLQENLRYVNHLRRIFKRSGPFAIFGYTCKQLLKPIVVSAAASAAR